MRESTYKKYISLILNCFTTYVKPIKIEEGRFHIFILCTWKLSQIMPIELRAISNANVPSQTPYSFMKLMNKKVKQDSKN